MQPLHPICNDVDMGRLPIFLPGLLHKTGSERTPQQSGSGKALGRDRALQIIATTRLYFGVRVPGADETGLSFEEVAFAKERGLL